MDTPAALLSMLLRVNKEPVFFQQIERVNIVSQPSSDLHLGVRVAAVDDHRLEISVSDVDGRFICSVDQQDVHVVEDAFVPQQCLADGQLLRIHLLVAAKAP